MDLLVFLDAPPRHRDLSLKACIATHRPITGDGRVAMLRHNGTPMGILVALYQAAMLSESEEVCVTSDTIIVVDGIDPRTAYAHKHSMYLKRKGAAMDAMVATIGLLLDYEMPTLDYEMMVPRAMKRTDLLATLAMAEGKPVLWSTLHHNRMRSLPVRMEDPLMPLWKYNYAPQVPSLALSDTCYANPDCITWLRKQVYS